MKTDAAAVLPWSFETNWAIAWGSLDGSVTIESSDHPIDDSDAESVCRKFPLILRPHAPQSAPCEIKVSFEGMYEVGQIYVRSTARAYEVYYSKSADGSNEYLCTVRCGVAEREEEVLTAPCFSVGEEEPSGEFSEETVSDRDASSNEDVWVNIKAPDVSGMKTGRMYDPQDLYEATANINDLDACSSLIIRFLSLQDKGQVYVDEVYIYATTLGSHFPENGIHLSGSSTQSSLMSMFFPAILQLSKSGGTQIQGSHTSQILENSHMDTRSRVVQETYVPLEENKKSDEQCGNLNEHEKCKVDPAEIQMASVENKCQERMSTNYSPAVNLEQTLHQLISRFNRVEDVCLRLEGNLTKHIENVEARLQQIEDKLENLSMNSQYSGLTNGTRIVAPAFSFSESNSSSIMSGRFNCSMTSEVEKENIPCNSMPNDTNLNSTIVYTAPEFSCEEDEEACNELNLVEASSIAESKKKVSVDDALAAALDGFISGSRAQPSENNKANSSHYSEEDTGNQLCENIKFSAGVDERLPTAQTANFHSFKHPDFSKNLRADETCGHRKNSLDIDSRTEDMDKENCDLVLHHIQVKNLPSQRLCVENEENLHPIAASNICPTSVCVNFTCLDSECTSRSIDMNARDLAEDFQETQVMQIQEETRPESIICTNQNCSNSGVSEDAPKHDPDALHNILREHVNIKEGGDSDALMFLESSYTSLLDFDFPIMHVKFTSDDNALSTFEDLLCGLGESDDNSEIPSISGQCGVGSFIEQANTSIIDGHEYNDALPIKDFLVDLEVPTENEPPSSMKGLSDEKCSSSSLQLYPSLV